MEVSGGQDKQVEMEALGTRALPLAHLRSTASAVRVAEGTVVMAEMVAPAASAVAVALVAQ